MDFINDDGVNEYIDVLSVSRETLENAYRTMCEINATLTEELRKMRLELSDERAVRETQTSMLARLR